jgi:hypothetical protein
MQMSLNCWVEMQISSIQVYIRKDMFKIILLLQIACLCMHVAPCLARKCDAQFLTNLWCKTTYLLDTVKLVICKDFNCCLMHYRLPNWLHSHVRRGCEDVGQKHGQGISWVHGQLLLIIDYTLSLCSDILLVWRHTNAYNMYICLSHSRYSDNWLYPMGFADQRLTNWNMVCSYLVKLL